MGCEDIIKYFYHMLLTIKLYHWSTYSYARHKASDALYEKLSELVDKFIEVYMGSYSRPKYEDKFDISVKQFDEEIIDELKRYIDYMSNELPKFLKESDTDLLNIRDEMLSELNQTLYLFTLK